MQPDHNECLMKEKWAVLDLTLSNVTIGQQEIKDGIEKIGRKLFVDNGAPSVQTRIERLEACMRIACWVGGIMGTAVIGMMARALVQFVEKQK